MLGLQINRENYSSSYASLSALCAALTVGLGIWLGPKAIFLSSGAGLILSAAGVVLGLRSESLSKPVGFPLTVLGIHGVFLVVGLVLQALFLSPLSTETQKIPHLQYTYTDPGGIFRVRGPAHWDYEGLPSRYEAGVRIRPSDQEHYMGISEISILIRKLESKPQSTAGFLQKMASTWVEKKKTESRIFEFEITPAELLDHKKGMWSILDAKRFWVPVRQISLLGIKDNVYLCSVSAIGLKNHSQLSKIFCLGLFQTIQINPREK